MASVFVEQVNERLIGKLMPYYSNHPVCPSMHMSVCPSACLYTNFVSGR